MKTLFGALMSMVVLAACTSPSASQPEQASKVQVQTQQTTQPTLAAKWRVVAFNKFTEKELADKNAYLDFSKMPKAYGNMGCNGIMFQANVIGAGKIDFGHIAVSMMLCEDIKETYYGSFSRSQVYRRKSLVDQTPYAQADDFCHQPP